MKKFPMVLKKFCKYAQDLKERFSKEKQYAEFVAAMGVEKQFDVESWLDELDIEEVE